MLLIIFAVLHLVIIIGTLLMYLSQNSFENHVTFEAPTQMPLGIGSVRDINFDILPSSKNKTARRDVSMDHYNYDDGLVNFICNDNHVIRQIQKYQWQMAMEEVLPGVPVYMNDKEMGFYDELYGALNLQLPPDKHPEDFESLLYYRIFKSGNDNIRSLLYEEAFHLTNQSAAFQQINCPADECAHSWVQRYSAADLRGIGNPKTLEIDSKHSTEGKLNQQQQQISSHSLRPYKKRFAFTFVREPIVRFVSAINEMECRAQEFRQRLQTIPVNGTLGSAERFVDWIHFILKSSATSSIIRQYQDIELGHVAPMVGTLVIGRRLEKQGLHLYRIERFGSEWYRLAMDVQWPHLATVYRKRRNAGFGRHKAAEDPHHIVQNAMTFLTTAGHRTRLR